MARSELGMRNEELARARRKGRYVIQNSGQLVCVSFLQKIKKAKSQEYCDQLELEKVRHVTLWSVDSNP